MLASMEPTQVILAVLAAGGDEARLDPVQIQHVLFLIDKTVPDAVDGPHFEFAPSSIGPFDQSVKASLLHLYREGLLSIETASQETLILLTPQGWNEGSAVLTRLEASIGVYLRELFAWVNSHDFRQRLSGIQTRFPDAVTNRIPTPSVQGKDEDPRRSLVRAYAQQSRRIAFLRGLGRVVDLYGTLNDSHQVLSALRASRDTSVPARDTWTEVGDYLREAMAQFATEFPPSTGDEDTRIA